jgi:hypothetical protein
MSFLSEYLERRRQALAEEEQQKLLEESSPEELLESLNANIEHNTDLIGDRHRVEDRQHTKVLDSLDSVSDSIYDFIEDDEKVNARVLWLEESELKESSLTNKTLREISATLRELSDTNKKIEKYLRPDLNPTDDTYAKKKAAEDVVKESKKETGRGSGGGLLDSLLGLLGLGGLFGNKPKPGTGTPTGTPTAPKPRGRLGRVFDSTKRVLGDAATKVKEVTVARAPAVRATTLKVFDAVKDTVSSTTKAVVNTADRLAPKATEAVRKTTKSAVESVKQVPRIAHKAIEYTKPAVEKSGKVLSRIKDATSAAYANVAPRVTSGIKTAVDATKPVVSNVRNVFTSAAESTKSTITNIVNKVRTPVETSAVKYTPTGRLVQGLAKPTTIGALPNATPSVSSRALTVLSKVATPLAIGLSAKEAYDTEQNADLTRDQKNVKHGGTVGGLAGGLTGATYGALAGSAVMPVLGTAVGGVLGGIGGYFGGGKLGEYAVEGLNASKDAIGAAVALAISPFSEDARNALKRNLLPSLDEFGNKVSTAGAAITTGAAATTVALGQSTDALSANVEKSTAALDNATSTSTKALTTSVGVAATSISTSADTIDKSTKTLQEKLSDFLSDTVKDLKDRFKDAKDIAGSTMLGAQQIVRTTLANTGQVARETVRQAKTGYERSGVTGAVSGAVGGFKEGSRRVALENQQVLSTAKGLAVGRYNEAERAAIYSAQKAGEKFRGGKGLTEETKAMITRIATEKGIDPQHLITIAQMESGGNSNAVSSTGAAGLFQFTGGTAKDMGLQNRFDPEQNTRAAADLYLRNKQALEARGEKATLDNVYLAHQQGAGGAVKLLKASRGQATLDATTRKNMGHNVGANAGGATDAERAAKFMEANKRALASASSTATRVTVDNSTYIKPSLIASTDSRRIALASDYAGSLPNTGTVSMTAQKQDKPRTTQTAVKPKVETTQTAVKPDTSTDTKARIRVASTPPQNTFNNIEPKLPSVTAQTRAYGDETKVRKIDTDRLIASSTTNSTIYNHLLQDPEINRLAMQADIQTLAKHPKVQQASRIQPTAPRLAAVKPKTTEVVTPIRQKTYETLETPKVTTISAKPLVASSVPIDVGSPSVHARMSPLAKVSSVAPEEVKPVRISNVQDITAKQSKTVPDSTVTGAFKTEVPSIDSIPLQVNDMGLILLNVGHI